MDCGIREWSGLWLGRSDRTVNPQRCTQVLPTQQDRVREVILPSNVKSGLSLFDYAVLQYVYSFAVDFGSLGISCGQI
jgi:hypothetical protein